MVWHILVITHEIELASDIKILVIIKPKIIFTLRLITVKLPILL